MTAELNDGQPVKTQDGLRAIRAMRDVMGGDRGDNHELIDRIASKRFGKGRAKVLRKLIVLAIAKNANPDGTESDIALETIAHRCLVTRQAVSKHLKWLENRLLRIEYKAGRNNTNRYAILWEASPQRPRKAKRAPATHVDMPQPLHVLTCNSGCTLPATMSNHTCNNDQLDLQIENEHDRPLDRPSLDRPHVTTTSPSDDAVDGVCSTSLKDKTSAKDQFLSEQQRLLDERGLGRTTSKHREQSWQKAQEVGLEYYLAGLSLWLEGDADKDCTLGEDEDGDTKTVTWPLRTFLDSPHCASSIERAKRWVDVLGHHTRSEEDKAVEIGFFDEHWRDETSVPSAEQIQGVRAAVTKHNWTLVRLATGDGERFWDDPLKATDATDQHYADLRAKREREARSKPQLIKESIQQDIDESKNRNAMSLVVNEMANQGESVEDLFARVEGMALSTSEQQI